MSLEQDAISKVGSNLKPDYKYNSLLVTKFINNLMLDGKKTIAQKNFYKAMDIIAKKVKDKTPLEVFEEAIVNVKPNQEVKSKRVGGATYQVPIDVPYKRQQTLAIRWLLSATRSKKGQKIHISLANELLDAFNKQGSAITTRTNIHKMAEANKAFAHFS
ncbi:MAG: 30S ribosomal protein S7 [Planctomycetota bacterium]|nr:MAG: 30S ribosomal protein S7 [Planctomycetota bacterium]